MASRLLQPFCRTCHLDKSIFLFFFNDTATTEIYTLSLHDALPISAKSVRNHAGPVVFVSHDAAQRSARFVVLRSDSAPRIRSFDGRGWHRKDAHSALVAGVAAAPRCGLRPDFQSHAFSSAIHALHRARFRVSGRGQGEARTDPRAEWLPAAETSEGIDDNTGGGRGAPLIRGSTGRDPALDQPRNVAEKIAADCAGRSAGTRSETGFP